MKMSNRMSARSWNVNAAISSFGFSYLQCNAPAWGKGMEIYRGDLCMSGTVMGAA